MCAEQSRGVLTGRLSREGCRCAATGALVCSGRCSPSVASDESPVEVFLDVLFWYCHAHRCLAAPAVTTAPTSSMGPAGDLSRRTGLLRTEAAEQPASIGEAHRAACLAEVRQMSRSPAHAAGFPWRGTNGDDRSVAQ